MTISSNISRTQVFTIDLWGKSKGEVIVIENITIEFKDDNGNIERVEEVVAYNIDDFPYEETISKVSYCHNRKDTYVNVACAFDIETSTVEEKNKLKIIHGKEKHSYLGFMYIWMFCFDDLVVIGRRWEEYLTFLDKLEETLHLSKYRKLVIYSHMLAFEFQFLRNYVTIDSIFARKKRVPLKAQFNECFEMRCSYFLSNMSLAKFIKNTPNARFNKQSGDDFDYRKLRLPNTPLSNEELSYCYCDVRGLCEAINHLLKEDTIASIPLTSTGFLRREARKVVLANEVNKNQVKELALTPELYIMCKTAARGGNTHANAIYANDVIEDMNSKDRKSSYPAEMVVDNYPVTPFQSIRPSKENLFSYCREEACLIDVTFYNLRLIKTQVIPYVPLAKCTRRIKCTVDNGRIAHGKVVSMVITDVDFNIIDSQYVYDDIEIHSLRVAKYGKLNNEFRNMIMDYFYQKCLLDSSINPEPTDPYLYAKFKNKINAFFGMMLTDICNPEITYNPDNTQVWDKMKDDANTLARHYKDRYKTYSENEIWGQGQIDLEQMLNHYYNKHTSFLSYQHGIWVTANARKRLQDALDIVDDDGVYTDTDSVKYIGDHEDDFRRLNEEWLAECESNDIKPYVDVFGKRIYLGTWDNDGEYSKFKTLGAKKYCYIKKGDDSNALHITVAGLSKDKGAKFLMERPDLKPHQKTDKNVGIEAFSIKTRVPEKYSGRTVAYYNDEPHIKEITIQDCTFTVGSNVAVIDASYTFGISQDYLEYLCNLEDSTVDFMEEIFYEDDF